MRFITVKAIRSRPPTWAIRDSKRSGRTIGSSILLKYKLAVPMAKLFFEIGFAPRTISGTITNTGVSINGTTGQQTPFSNSMGTNWTSSVGVVAGGGVQFGLGRLRVLPELRYTYWPNTSINMTFSNGPSFHSNQQQFDLLVKIGWRIIGGGK